MFSTSDLNTNQVPYYQGFSFFGGLELHASYDWQDMASDTHHGLFLMCHFVRTYLRAELENYRSCKDVLPIEQLLYYQRYLFSRIELYVRYSHWVMAPNTHRNFFPIRHFVHTYTHSSKTTGYIWMFYKSNDYSTIGDVYFLC